MSLEEAAKQALKDLEALKQRGVYGDFDGVTDALKAALEQPEQEPVAWMVYTEDGKSAYVTDNPHDLVGAYKAFALYTHPPRREWKTISDDEIAALYVKWDATPGVSMADFARSVETKLKEKNA